jgi:hypothetical protein
MMEPFYAPLLGREYTTGPNSSLAITKEKREEGAPRNGLPPYPHAETRKHLLFLAACYRRIEYLLIPEAKRLLELHERDADYKKLRSGQEAKAREKLEAVVKLPFSNTDGLASARTAAAEAARWLLICEHDTDVFAVLDEIGEAVRRDPNYPGGPDGEAPHQADLLRDIYGTPYTQVEFDKRWRTDTALSLASQMYDSRDFGAMPILADALQDAGCEDPAILAHCRDANQVHVRGCWVVDLVLGKA